MRTRENIKDPVEQARDEERQRIASELHDRVLPVLAGAALRLEAARKHVLSTEKAPQDDLWISEEGVRSALREIRSILADTHKRTWQTGTLLEKIRNEVQTTACSAKLAISLQIDPPDLAIIDAHVEYDLFEATGEALRNVVRHANATAATLSIALTDNTLQVSLSDNGEGFETTAAASPDSGTDTAAADTYGLRSMASRIERLGGSMAIRSRPRQGTTVFFEIPIAVPVPARGSGR